MLILFKKLLIIWCRRCQSCVHNSFPTRYVTLPHQHFTHTFRLL